jgi:hypothetical protein
MRKGSLIALSVAALVCIAVIVSLAHVPDERETDKREKESNEVRIGLKISPVPLNLKGKDIHLVGLGSYIVNAQASCADCHSCPTYSAGHNPYVGQSKQFNPENYLAGGVPFGPFISANLTPDANGKPAGLSAHKFKHTIRTGEDPDVPGRLLQVMPWPVLQSMTDHDIRAIYEYLRAIPSAQPGSCTGAGEAGQ